MTLPQDQPFFNEGDIFYTRYDGKYHLYKLLRIEEDTDTYHVLIYEPQDDLPGIHGTDTLKVFAFHSPISRNSFAGAQFYTSTKVSDDELIGFYEYMKRMDEHYETAAGKATEYYHKAYTLTDQGKHEEAIEYYSKAIGLMPDFYEAIDNRAFCRMDLERWTEAIADFQLSLQVNPGSLLAEFSIGECYYRMGSFEAAREQFKKCLQIDPRHQVSQDFLIRSEELIQKRNELKP